MSDNDKNTGTFVKDPGVTPPRKDGPPKPIEPRSPHETPKDKAKESWHSGGGRFDVV